jgi:hypothetical protein
VTAVHRFELQRHTDVTGVSGEGKVAEGVRLDDNTAVVRWLGDKPSYVLWPDYGHAVAVHGHHGLTVFVPGEEVVGAPAAELRLLVDVALGGLAAWFAAGSSNETGASVGATT